MARLDQRVEYSVQIQGCIDAGLVAAGPVQAGRVTVDAGRGVTILHTVITDQAGLVGLLRHLHGLGLVLLAITRVPPGECQE